MSIASLPLFVNKVISRIHHRLPFLKNVINPETISYLFWGMATTLVNVGLFEGLFRLGLNYIIANAIALVSAKIFAYFTNKKYVFKSHCHSKKELCEEIVRFAAARGFTMLVDFVLLIVLVDYFMTDPSYGKIITTIIVIILNYLLSKFLVFKNEKKSSENP